MTLPKKSRGAIAYWLRDLIGIAEQRGGDRERSILEAIGR